MTGVLGRVGEDVDGGIGQGNHGCSSVCMYVGMYVGR